MSGTRSPTREFTTGSPGFDDTEQVPRAPETQPEPTVDAAFVARIRTTVATRLAARDHDGLNPDDRQALAAQLIAAELELDARERLERGVDPLDEVEEAAIVQAVRSSLFGLGPLDALLGDTSITDIHAVGCEPVILDFADGTKGEGPPLVRIDEDLIDLGRTIGRTEGISERRLDLAHPVLNVQLRDGSRLFFVAWVTKRPHLFIRRHRLLDVTFETLIELGTLTDELARFLGAAVRSHRNLLVAGGMGVGKTTLLRALAAEVDPEERIVTVETDYELALDRFPERHPDLVALEARDANVEGAGAVSCAELVRFAMRMSASRLVVGEVLGAEVIPMLNAMHSGAAGSMCTVHANSSGDALAKLALLAVQAPEHLEIPHTYALAARALDLVVFLTRDDHGRRLIQSVREVTGSDGSQVATNEVFASNPGQAAERTSVALTEATRAALASAGYREAFR